MSGAASSDYVATASSAAVVTAASLLHLLLLLLLLLLLHLLKFADQPLLFSDVGSDRHTDWTGWALARLMMHHQLLAADAPAWALQPVLATDKARRRLPRLKAHRTNA